MKRTMAPMDDLKAAWAELHVVTPPGWLVGRPAFDERRDEWSMWAGDMTHKPIGRPEWTAIAPTQARVVREMARCLREIAAGRVPGLGHNR